MRERVLITGGASGIGAAIAHQCQTHGYETVIIDRVGGFIEADLRDAAQTAEALQVALKGGPITRLVNNVGMVAPASVHEQSLEQFDSVISLNLRCAMQCLQALYPGMRDVGFGRVVNMSSRASLGKTHRTAYAASKAGLIGMTRVWALELGAVGITVNAVAPGPIATDLFANANPDSAPQTRKILESIPVRRAGLPEDVANATAFFLTRESSFVTGQVLYVCGGASVGGVAT